MLQQRLKYHEGTVGVFKRGVSGQNGVVRFNDGVSHLGSRVDTKLQFRFLSVILGKTVEEKGTETGTRSTAKSVKDKKALKARAVVREAADFIANTIDDFFTDCIVTSSI